MMIIFFFLRRRCKLRTVYEMPTTVAEEIFVSRFICRREGSSTVINGEFDDAVDHLEEQVIFLSVYGK